MSLFWKLNRLILTFQIFIGIFCLEGIFSDWKIDLMASLYYFHLHTKCEWIYKYNYSFFLDNWERRTTVHLSAGCVWNSNLGCFNFKGYLCFCRFFWSFDTLLKCKRRTAVWYFIFFWDWKSQKGEFYSIISFLYTKFSSSSSPVALSFLPICRISCSWQSMSTIKSLVSFNISFCSCSIGRFWIQCHSL